ncbi:MAG: glycerophosphodiester phosphodiesterase [Acidimicrobiia bacterium]|nr:glycerophosphodiester phosphodiesterase [Acidimicrobiia bacterium]
MAAPAPRRPVTLVVAHRGASVGARQNTAEAFRRARDLGADWVELDVRRTVDDVLVAHHDAHLPDGRLVARTPLDELPPWIPPLAEALEACEGMGVVVEIKNDPAEVGYDGDNAISVAVAGLVSAYRPYDEVMISSFNAATIQRIRHVDSRLPTALIMFDPVVVAQSVDRAAAAGHAAIHPYHTAVDASLLRRAHRASVAVWAWTVNDPGDIEALVRLGTDGIITDDCPAARAITARVAADG